MSFAHMKAVMDFEAGAVTGSRLLLLVYLANCANDQGKCWPSKAQIFEKTGITDKTFRKALADLEAIGAVSVERKTGRGIVYTVALPTGKLQSLENSSGSHWKIPVGSLENSSGVTGKFQSKSINNLSTLSQEPINSNSSDESVVPNSQIDQPRRRSSKPSIQKPEGVKQSVWEEWMKLKTARSRVFNQHMVDAIVREASKANMTTEEAMVCQLENGWQGFKAEWVANKHQSTKSLKNADVTEMDSWDAIYS